MTPLKTLLKELFGSKGEIPEKTHGRITLEQEMNPVQILHPRQRSNSPFPGMMHSQMLGGNVEASI